MQDMQQSAQSTATAMPAMVDPLAVSGCHDSEYALGCECAYPSLQIERWGEEDGAADLG